MPNYGKYDKLLVVEKPDYTEDDNGQLSVESWSVFGSVWGCSILVTQNELIESIQVTAMQQRNFESRYLYGVTPSMRIVCDGEYFYIIDVFEKVRKHTLIIKAEKKDNA